MSEKMHLDEALAYTTYWRNISPYGPDTKYEKAAYAHAQAVIAEGARQALQRFTAPPKEG